MAHTLSDTSSAPFPCAKRDCVYSLSSRELGAKLPYLFSVELGEGWGEGGHGLGQRDKVTVVKILDKSVVDFRTAEDNTRLVVTDLSVSYPWDICELSLHLGAQNESSEKWVLDFQDRSTWDIRLQICSKKFVRCHRVSDKPYRIFCFVSAEV